MGNLESKPIIELNVPRDLYGRYLGHEQNFFFLTGKQLGTLTEKRFENPFTDPVFKINNVDHHGECFYASIHDLHTYTLGLLGFNLLPTDAARKLYLVFFSNEVYCQRCGRQNLDTWVTANSEVCCMACHLDREREIDKNRWENYHTK